MTNRFAIIFVALALTACGQDNSQENDVISQYESPHGSIDDFAVDIEDMRPSITVFPSSLIFENTKAEKVTISNDGNVDLLDLNIEIAGDIDAITLGECTNANELSGGSSCTLTVQANTDYFGTGELRISALDYAKSISILVPRKSVDILNTVQEETYDPALLALLRTPAGSQESRSVQLARPVNHARNIPDVEMTNGPYDPERVLPSSSWISFSLDNELRLVRASEFKGIVDYPIYSSNMANPELLIPQGSIVSGTVLGSQTELPELLVREIRTTDGVIIKVGDLQGADAMGRIGVPAKIDWQTLRRYGPSAIISATTAAAEALIGEDTESAITDGTVIEETSARTEAINRFGEDMQEIGERMLDERSQIPILAAIPKGEVVNIITTQSIYFPTKREQMAMAIEQQESNQQSSAGASREISTTPTISSAVDRILERQQ